MADRGSTQGAADRGSIQVVDKDNSLVEVAGAIHHVPNTVVEDNYHHWETLRAEEDSREGKDRRHTDCEAASWQGGVLQAPGYSPGLRCYW